VARPTTCYQARPTLLQHGQPFVTPKNPKFEINKRNQSKVFLMNNYTLEFTLSKINNNIKTNKIETEKTVSEFQEIGNRKSFGLLE
jgi:hypothetical protein